MGNINDGRSQFAGGVLGIDIKLIIISLANEIPCMCIKDNATNMSSKWDSYGPAPEGTGDLSPLDDQLRSGLKVIGVLAVFSLILCSSLFLFITYRVIDGRLRDRQQSERLTSRARFNLEDLNDNDGFRMDSPTSPNLQMTPTTPLSPKGLKSGAPTSYHDQSNCDSHRTAVPNIRQRYKGYHPLLVLIYMLLIADIIQSASFIPNLVWVTHDAIMVRTESCVSRVSPSLLPISEAMSYDCLRHRQPRIRGCCN